VSYNFDLFDTIQTHVDKLQDRIYTSLPATVTSYKASEQSVDVTLDVRLVNALTKEESPTTALRGVPVVFPAGGGGILSFPIKAGDKVLICFSKYSIDKWKNKGAGVAGENRQHSISDAIAICGLFTQTSNLSPSDSDVELKFAGTTVSLKSSGDVEITPAGKTTINSDLDVNGDINCSKTVTASTDCIGGGKSLKNHKHGGVQSGGSQTTPPV
jgi:hypothetical protein